MENSSNPNNITMKEAEKKIVESLDVANIIKLNCHIRIITEMLLLDRHKGLAHLLDTKIWRENRSKESDFHLWGSCIPLHSASELSPQISLNDKSTKEGYIKNKRSRQGTSFKERFDPVKVWLSEIQEYAITNNIVENNNTSINGRHGILANKKISSLLTIHTAVDEYYRNELLADYRINDISIDRKTFAQEKLRIIDKKAVQSEKEFTLEPQNDNLANIAIHQFNSNTLTPESPGIRTPKKVKFSSTDFDPQQFHDSLEIGKPGKLKKGPSELIKPFGMGSSTKIPTQNLGDN